MSDQKVRNRLKTAIGRRSLATKRAGQALILLALEPATYEFLVRGRLMIDAFMLFRIFRSGSKCLAENSAKENGDRQTFMSNKTGWPDAYSFSVRAGDI